jgi:hypothetical protein
MSAELAAGREMDAAVHKAVFGEAPRHVGVVWFVGNQGAELPRYSAEIAAAWQVVEKMGPRFDGLYPSYDEGRFMDWVAITTAGTFESRRGHLGKTAAEAICRAALGLP